jgi:hypothetical protein
MGRTGWAIRAPAISGKSGKIAWCGFLLGFLNPVQNFLRFLLNSLCSNHQTELHNPQVSRYPT